MPTTTTPAPTPQGAQAAPSPAPAPSTPAFPVAQSDPGVNRFDAHESAIADIVSQTLGTMVPASAPPSALPKADPSVTPDAAPEAVQALAEGIDRGDGRDILGRFVSPPSSDGTADAPEGAPEAADAAGQGEAAPEGAEAAGEGTEPAKPKWTPVTKFALTTEAGEALALPDDHVVRYTVAGEERAETIDRVIRRAQMAHGAEQQVAQVTQAAEQRLAALEQQVAQDRAVVEAMLADATGETWRMAAELHAQANTPEAKLAREREAFEAQKQQYEVRQVAAIGEAYHTGVLVPALTKFHAEHLPHVDMVDLQAWTAQAVAPLRDARTGLIPPERYAEVARVISEDVASFALTRNQQIADRIRATARAEAETLAKQQLEQQAAQRAAQVRAQQAASKKVQGLAPTQTASTPAVPAPSPASVPIRTAQDAMDAGLAEVLAAVRAA